MVQTWLHRTPGIRNLLDGMPATPAYLVDAAYNVLAWNQLAIHFIGRLARQADRNMIRWTFRRRADHPAWSDEDFVRFTRATVADLRAGYARYPGDPGIESVVTEMLALSAEFAEMWGAHEVEVRGPMLKRVNHPRAGPLEFECQVPAHRGDRPAPHRLLRRSGVPDRGGVHRAGRAARAWLARSAVSLGAMSRSRRIGASVVIVGGGPVGLALAVDARQARHLVRARGAPARAVSGPEGAEPHRRAASSTSTSGTAPTSCARLACCRPGYPIGGITAYENLASEYWYAPAGRETVSRFLLSRRNERLPQYLTE